MADLGVPRVVLGWSGGTATDLSASGVAGSCFIFFFFCVSDFIFLLTIAGQMRS